MAQKNEIMNRSDIIKQLALGIYGRGYTAAELKQCEQFCENLVDIITDALVDGKKILWQNFFSMEITQRKARNGVNPRTGEERTYPPIKTILCKFSRNIKDAINERY